MFCKRKKFYVEGSNSKFRIVGCKSEKKKTIGFVILVWNSAGVINKCLKSIVELEKITPYVVVVDNGSTDSTPQILENYIAKYPDTIHKIQYKENRGTTVSRNDGLRLLMKDNFDYYCIIDSDTEISDIAFLKMIEELEKNEMYGLIGPKMRTASGVVQMSARAFPTLLEKIYKAFPSESIQAKGYAMEVQKPDKEGMESYPVDYLMSACWLLKPEAIKAAGLLDEKIFYAPEDAEYCIRIWKSGYQVAYCPEAQIIHEWQRLSKKKLISKMNWEHIKGLAYMFYKHHYLFTTNELKKKFK